MSRVTQHHRKVWHAVCQLRRGARTLDLVALCREGTDVSIIARSLDITANELEAELPKDVYTELHKQTFPNDHEAAYQVGQELYNIEKSTYSHTIIVSSVDTDNMVYKLSVNGREKEFDFKYVHKFFEPVD
jgi:hypothetical protein